MKSYNKIKDPEYTLKSISNNISPVVKRAFFSAIIIGICTHLYFFLRQTANEDSIGNYYELYNLYSSGRWLLGYVTALTANYNLPFVIGCISIFYLSITSAITVSILEIKNDISAICIAGLLVTFPVLAYAFGYLFMAEGYMLALLLAALAVFLTKKYRLGWIWGGVSLAICLGIYQAYIGYSIVLIMLLIIVKAITQEYTGKQLIQYITKFLGMGIVGVGLYFISLNMYLNIIGGQLSEYKGANEMGRISLQELPTLIIKAYSNFIGFFYGEYFNVSNIMKSLYIIALILIGYFCSYIIIRRMKDIKIINIVVVIGFILLLPLGINIVDIIAPETSSGNLTIYQMVLVFVFLVVLLEMYYEHVTLIEKSKLCIVHNVIQWLTLVVIVTIGFNYFLLNNTYYLKIESYYDRTLALTNRMIARIEELPQYTSNSRIAIIGNLPNPNYPNSSYMFPEIKKDQGLWGQYIGLSSGSDVGNSRKFAEFVDVRLGIPLIPANQDIIDKIKNSQEYMQMEPWPAANSIQYIHDTVVVNLDYSVGVEVEHIQGNTYKFKARGDMELLEGCQYAWYLYRDGERIATQWYRDEDFVQYELESAGVYKVLMFINKEDNTNLTTQYSDDIEIK